MSDNELKRLINEVDPSLLDEQNFFDIYEYSPDGRWSDKEKAVKIDNPFDIDHDSFLPNEQTFSLERFWTLASDLVDYAQERADVDSDDRVVLKEAHPPETMNDIIGKKPEIITYKVRKRIPALMDRKGRGRPQQKARVSHNLNLPSSPNKILVMSGRPIDHDLEFTCWSTKNYLASERAIWLERLLINHSWVFQVQGADRFRWTGRGADTFYRAGSQRLAARSLTFKLRYTEIEARAVPKIQRIRGGIII